MNRQNNKRRLVRGSRIQSQDLSNYFITPDNEVDDDAIDNFVENRKNEYRIKRDNIVKSCKQNPKKYNYSDCYNDPKCKENCIDYDINIMDINALLGESEYVDNNDEYYKNYEKMNAEFEKYSDRFDEEYYKNLELIDDLNSKMNALNFRGSKSNMYTNDYRHTYTNLAQKPKHVNHGYNTECGDLTKFETNESRQDILTVLGQKCNVYLYNKYLIKHLNIILCNLNHDSNNGSLKPLTIKKYMLVLFYLLQSTFYKESCRAQRDCLDQLYIASIDKNPRARFNALTVVYGKSYVDKNNKNKTLACTELIHDYLQIISLIQEIYYNDDVQNFFDDFEQDRYRSKYSEDKLDRYEMLRGEIKAYRDEIIKVMDFYKLKKFRYIIKKVLDDGKLIYDLDN